MNQTEATLQSVINTVFPNGKMNKRQNAALRALQPYIEDTSRRAVESNHQGPAQCRWQTHDGRRCAASAMLTKDAPRASLDGNGYSASWSSAVTDYDVRAFLKNEFNVLTDDNIERIQTIHDKNANWTEDGLSQKGIKELKQLMEELS